MNAFKEKIMKMRRFCLVLCLSGCTFTPDPKETLSSLPEVVPAPDDNPTTLEAVELGRMLFWDPILSGDRDVACASCHHPDFAYADGLTFPIGVGGHFITTARNTPTVLGAALNGWTVEGYVPPEQAPMFWDNRAESLEMQALGPLKNPDEMRGTTIGETEILDVIVARLTNIPEYTTLFEAAYGANGVNATNLAKAIAAFERTLVPRGSSFDRYLDGDDNALNTSQIRGMHGFILQGCAGCHSGPMLSDYKLHNLKVPARIGEPGYGEAVFPEIEGAKFRTPSLRMVMATAPYMHNGVFQTIDETIDFYHNIDHHIEVDPLLTGDVEVAHGQGDDILAFFSALSDGTFDKTIPNRVPSGLVPAGGR